MVLLLTTKENCYVFQKKDSGSTDQDAILDLFIAAISDEIIRWLGYDPTIKLKTDYFDVNSYKYQFTIESAGLKKVHEVINDPDRLYTQDPIPSTRYAVYPHGEILFDQEILSHGFRSLRIKHYSGITLNDGEFIDILSAPPSTPSNGDVYIVGISATGAWLGQEEKVATWNGSSWDFTDQQVNFLANNASLALAVTAQVIYTVQTVNKLGANYTALQSHVKTYSAVEGYLPQVQRALNLFKRTLFHKS